MTEAIVHVGVHKTGTSSIQRVMATHRPQLLEQGFLYPRFSPNHYDLHTAFCSNPLKYHMVRGRGLKTLEEIDHLRASVLGSIQEEVSETGAPRLLMVAEDISTLDADELGRMRDWLDSIGVHQKTMYIYLRDHISFWESQVQQHVKGGTAIDIARETHRLSLVRVYRSHLSALRSVFGAENVRVNVFGAKHLAGGDVIVDFAGKIGLNIEGMELIRANESLSRDAMLFLNEMNRRIETYGEHGRSLLRDGLLAGLRTHKGPKLKADLETSRRIYARSAPDRAYLAEIWFDGADPLGEIMQENIAKLEGSEMTAQERGEHDAAGAFEVAAHLYRQIKEENLKLAADRFRLKGVLKRKEGEPQRAKEFLDKWRRLKRELALVEKGE